MQITNLFQRYVYKMMPWTVLPKNEEAAAAHKEAKKVGALVNALTVGIQNTDRKFVMDNYYGHLELIQYLTSNNNYYGHLELIQYLTSNNNLPAVITIQIGRKGLPGKMEKLDD